jgi:hypothetical protein
VAHSRCFFPAFIGGTALHPVVPSTVQVYRFVVRTLPGNALEYSQNGSARCWHSFKTVKGVDLVTWFDF